MYDVQDLFNPMNAAGLPLFLLFGLGLVFFFAIWLPAADFGSWFS